MISYVTNTLLEAAALSLCVFLDYFSYRRTVADFVPR